MWEEEHPPPGFRTATEEYVTWQFIGLGVLSTWLVAGDFPGGPAICAAVSALSVFFYFQFRHEAAIATRPGRALFRHWFLVPLAMIALWAVAQFNPSVQLLDIGHLRFFVFEPPRLPGPASGLAWENWTRACYHVLVLSASIGLVAFTTTQHAIARVLWALTINAMALGAVGLVTGVMRWEKILATLTPAQPAFYSVFPHAHQWAAFALFWVIAGFGLLFHVKRRKTWGSLLERNGMWLIAGWLILAGSVFWTGAPVHRFLIMVVLGLLGFRVGSALIRHLRANRWSPPLGMLLCGAGIATISAGLFEFVTAFESPEAAPFGIPWPLQSALWREAWDLFLARPLFGWGDGSFEEIIALRQFVDLGPARYASCHSDFLQALVEHGLAGMALWLAFPVGLAWKFLHLPIQRSLSHYLWGGATTLGALAVVSQPLSSPANFALLWTAVAAAYQWSNTARHSTPLPVGSQLKAPGKRRRQQRRRRP